MDFVEIFNISLDLSTIIFAHFSGCSASFVHSCHSILESDDLFYGVKLSIRSFCFIFMLMSPRGSILDNPLQSDETDEDRSPNGLKNIDDLA